MTTDQQKRLICPKCNRSWGMASEQAASIILFDECVCCRFGPHGNGSPFDVQSVQRKAKELGAYTQEQT